MLDEFIELHFTPYIKHKVELQFILIFNFNIL